MMSVVAFVVERRLVKGRSKRRWPRQKIGRGCPAAAAPSCAWFSSASPQILGGPLVLVGPCPVADGVVRVGGRRLRRGAGAVGVDVPAGGRMRRVAVHGVLVALGEPEGDLLGLRVLDPELEATGAATTGMAAGAAVVVALGLTDLPVAAAALVAADVLAQRLVLVGLRGVGHVGGRGRGRRLGRVARTRRDVLAGDRHGGVAVDGVLVALGEPEGQLLGIGLLDTSLETACASAAGVATGAADVLAQVLVLIGLRLVLDVGVSRRRRGLRRVARTGAHVPSGDRDGHVRVDRVLMAGGNPGCQLLGVCVLNPELEAAGATATGFARPAAADGLVELLILVGLRLVRDGRVGIRARVLVRGARA